MYSHLRTVPVLAAGMKPLPDEIKTKSHRQGLYRLLSNPVMTPQMLSQPVMDDVRDGAQNDCDDFLLMMHDWSRLNYYKHTGKEDRIQLSHHLDVGYDMQSSLAVSDRSGQAIGCAAVNLACNKGTISTWRDGWHETEPHLNELLKRTQWLESQNLGKRLVHIVDREADSVAHMRQMSANNQLWLFRCKAKSSVEWKGEQMSACKAAASLSFRVVRQFEHTKGMMTQHVGSAEVQISRDACVTHKNIKGKKRVEKVPGEHIKARLVVSRIYDESGSLFATWYLITNVDDDVPDDRITLWYYWRWKIETYFKLLKKAGQQLESWEQESAVAIIKRLQIANKACSVAWMLMRKDNPEAQEVKELLVRFSGRQMKKKGQITAPALMDGICMLISCLQILKNHSIEELNHIASIALPGFNLGKELKP